MQVASKKIKVEKSEEKEPINIIYIHNFFFFFMCDMCNNIISRWQWQGNGCCRD